MHQPVTMQAAQYLRYGTSDVLEINTVPIPTPRPHQLLLRVVGSSVNRADAIARSGGTRLTNGFRFPKGTGVDVLGEVVARGAKCTRFSPGDLVWGYVGMVTMPTTGAAAQYTIIDEGSVSLAPQTDSPEDAAALPLVAMTALQALRDRLRVGMGDRILIVGASGGVGSSAIQIARVLGGQAESVSSSANLALCRELGATAAHDHQNPSSLENSAPFDAILDCSGVNTWQYRRHLKRGGRMTTIAPGGLPAVLKSQLSSRRVSFLAVKVVSNDLAWLASHVESGAIRPVIDQRYPLSEIARAHDHVASAHSRGKSVVIP